jgi:transcriptional regulator with XRE-family HTH domain
MYNEKLQLFFKEKGIKQYEIAKKLGYTPQMISRYLKGQDKINADFISKMVKEFPDVDLQYLFTDEQTTNRVQEPSAYYGLKKLDNELKIIEEKVAEIRKDLAQISHTK